MKILTVENRPYELDTVPDEIDDLRYCALDASDRECIDFYFLPLIFLESFYACLLYTSPSPRDVEESRMPSSA